MQAKAFVEHTTQGITTQGITTPSQQWQQTRCHNSQQACCH
jgi:hypothetical protein